MRLAREFFSRDAATVASELPGMLLSVDGGAAVARIVEVEAYLGLSDMASHAYRGPTPRSQVMFGPPGHLYVYLSYGMHFCANVVCEPKGTAGAVLLRAAVVEQGEAHVSGNRGGVKKPTPSHRLLSGPGNLCRGMGISIADNTADLCHAEGRIFLADDGLRPPIMISPRVGISKARELPLRFSWRDHPAVSNPRP